MAVYLFVLGVFLLFVEFTLVGFGFFALASLLSFMGALYYALGATPMAGYIVAIILVIGIIIFFYLMKKFPNSRFWKRLTLHLNSSTDKGYVSNTIQVDLLGKEGVAHTVLRPAGTARFGESYRDVVTEGIFLDKGTPIKVVAVEGGRVVVRKVEK